MEDKGATPFAGSILIGGYIMKLFKNESVARKSLHEKDKIYTNGLCPYNREMLCGSWCSLFYASLGNEKTSDYIILGCKSGTDKKLFIG